MSAEEIEEDVMELFGFCGCGAPWEIVSYLKKYLDENKDWDNRGQLNVDVAYWLMAYLCDLHGLTEHGSSVGGAWLTDLGKEWLNRLSNYEGG